MVLIIVVRIINSLRLSQQASLHQVSITQRCADQAARHPMKWGSFALGWWLTPPALPFPSMYRILLHHLLHWPLWLGCRWLTSPTLVCVVASRNPSPSRIPSHVSTVSSWPPGILNDVGECNAFVSKTASTWRPVSPGRRVLGTGAQHQVQMRDWSNQKFNHNIIMCIIVIVISLDETDNIMIMMKII